MQAKTISKTPTQGIMYTPVAVDAFPPSSANGRVSHIGCGITNLPVSQFNLQKTPSGSLFSDLANQVIHEGSSKRVCLKESPSKISNSDISNLESKI